MTKLLQQRQRDEQDPISMEGMVNSANQVLDRALSPDTIGVPREFFTKAKGLVLVSAIEVGFMFSGNIGTGIALAKDDNGKWSAPCAVGLGGMGWGFLIGASVKDMMIFLFDDSAVAALTGDAGIKFGGQGEITLGPWGRTAEVALNLSNKGVGGSATVAFTDGLFGALSLEGSIVGPRSATNRSFYGKDVSPKQIMYEMDASSIPEGNLMYAVYDKLEMLSGGGQNYRSRGEEQST